MTIDIQELDALYLRYGYKKEISDENLRVYLYEQGRYFGADIIPLNQDAATLYSCEKSRSEYSNGGYAVQIKKIDTVTDASDELYRSFFSYDTTLSRLKIKYKNFKKNQESVDDKLKCEKSQVKM